MEWVKLILSNATGVVAIIGLLITMGKYVKQAVQEKRWGKIVKLVTGYMSEAEKKFEDGADKKQWVLAMVQVSAEQMKYDINMSEVAQLIDDLCTMSKVVNAPDAEAGKEAGK